MAVGDNIQVTEGSGKRLATGATYTENSQTVRDEKTIQGEPYLATYTVLANSISAATANSHVLQIMAGSSLHVYLRRLVIYQSQVATTAALMVWDLFRLTTAGTGGGSTTPAPLDTTDAASGATGMTLPTAQGTEGTRVFRFGAEVIQTVPTGGSGNAAILVDYTWDGLRTKCPRIPSGTANGLAIKNVTAVANMLVNVVATITEAPF